MRVLLSLLLLSATTLSAAPDELWIAKVDGRESGAVDRALENYLPASRDALRLAGLTLVDTEKEPLVPGQSSVAKFKGGYSMEVKCIQRHPTRYTLALTLADQAGPLLETSVEIARDRPIILAGPTSAEGRVLFFVVIR